MRLGSNLEPTGTLRRNSRRSSHVTSPPDTSRSVSAIRPCRTIANSSKRHRTWLRSRGTHDELQRRGRSLSQDFTVGERQAVSNIIEHGAKDNLMEHIAIHNLETAVMRYMSVPAHREELGQLYGENKDAQYVAAALRVLSEPQSSIPRSSPCRKASGIPRLPTS